MRAGMETGPPAFGAGEFRRFVSEDRFEATGTSMSWQVGGDAAIRAASCWRLGSEGPGKMDGVPQSWGKCCQQLGCDVGAPPPFFRAQGLNKICSGPAGPTAIAHYRIFSAQELNKICSGPAASKVSAPRQAFRAQGPNKFGFSACRRQGHFPSSNFQGAGAEQNLFRVCRFQSQRPTSNSQGAKSEQNLFRARRVQKCIPPHR